MSNRITKSGVRAIKILRSYRPEDIGNKKPKNIKHRLWARGQQQTSWISPSERLHGRGTGAHKPYDEQSAYTKLTNSVTHAPERRYLPEL
jgi:hypothetical protein